MEKEALYDALTGLSAYDAGATDSGIQDEVLRRKVIEHLNSLDEQEFRLVISRYVRDTYLTDEALQQGYGLEDVIEFAGWMSTEMGMDIA